MSIIIKGLIFIFLPLFVSTDKFVVYKNNKKIKLSFEKNSMYVLKNDISCLDCFNKIGKKLKSSYCSKYLIILKDKKEPEFTAEKFLKNKATELNDYTCYFENCKKESLKTTVYSRNSLFFKMKVIKTPFIITSDNNGKIEFWDYSRIFCYGDIRVNDTLENIFR